MKKIYFLPICVIFVLFGCPHHAEISNSNDVQEAQKNQFYSVSGLAYIGGSVVYNPENTPISQLHRGAKIAIYMGKVTPKTIQAEAYDSISQKPVESISSVNIDESQDSYGYLDITSVSSQSITFTYHRYINDRGSKRSSSHTIRAGKTLDLNKDGNPDLTYIPLLPIRDGFDGAMCLEFISSQEKLYTTMYATMTDDVLTRSAKSFSQYENATFYGVNSDGSFIYIIDENTIQPTSRSAGGEPNLNGISHGDYVINQVTGEISAVVGEVGSDLTRDDYSTDDAISLKGSDDYTKSNENYNFSENDNYELEVFFNYLYRKNQFADEDGPRELLKKLPRSLLSDENFDVENCTPDEAINELFDILTQGSVVEIIAEEKGIELTAEEEQVIDGILFKNLKAVFPSDIYAQFEAVRDDYDELERLIDENWDSMLQNPDEKLSTEAFLDLIAMNRAFIENNYPESPPAIVHVPEISTVYPLMSINIGDIPTDLNEAASVPEIQPSYLAAAPEEQNEQYAAYVSKKASINEEFDKFYSISLESVSISNAASGSPSAENKDSSDESGGLTIEAEKCHFALKLGVTGSFNSRWGHLDSGLAAAIYVAAEANFKEIQQTLTLYEKELFDQDKIVMVGPVPLTIGIEGKFALDLDAEIYSPINFAMGFIGMYGGGASFKADYGFNTKWIFFIPIPYAYFYPSIKGYPISHTASYAGPVTKANNFANSFGGNIVLTPTFTLAPKLYIGPKLAYAGIKLPFGIYFKKGYGMYHSSMKDKIAKLTNDHWFPTGYVWTNIQSWRKMAIGSSIKVQPVIGVKIPVINKKVETNWSALTLLRGEMALTPEGFKFSGGYLEP